VRLPLVGRSGFASSLLYSRFGRECERPSSRGRRGYGMCKFAAQRIRRSEGRLRVRPRHWLRTLNVCSCFPEAASGRSAFGPYSVIEPLGQGGSIGWDGSILRGNASPHRRACSVGNGFAKRLVRHCKAVPWCPASDGTESSSRVRLFGGPAGSYKASNPCVDRQRRLPDPKPRSLIGDRPLRRWAVRTCEKARSGLCLAETKRPLRAQISAVEIGLAVS
jgi:hypothetical protein